MKQNSNSFIMHQRRYWRQVGSISENSALTHHHCRCSLMWTRTTNSTFIPTLWSEETYASWVLSPNQSVHDGEGTVLSVLRNLSTDQLAVSPDNITFAARKLEPSKQTWAQQESNCPLAGKIYNTLRLPSPLPDVSHIYLYSLSTHSRPVHHLSPL